MPRVGLPTANVRCRCGLWPSRNVRFERDGCGIGAIPRPSAVSKRRPWTLADVLDFEALLHLDAQGDPNVLRERDAKLWQEKVSPGLSQDEAGDRNTVFHRWLTARRAQLSGKPLPGTWLLGGWRALGGLAGTAGVVLGFAVATTALFYSGQRPVNVSVFLATTVFIQWLLILWFLLVSLFRGFRQAAGRFLVRSADAIGSWLAALTDHLPGDQRMRVQGEAQALKHLAGRNGELLKWPPLIALQCFGVAWNLGVLAALFLRVSFTDVAFGWESTWARGPETAHGVVHALAEAWLWLVPDACPTLAQVTNTWFHYQTGVEGLDRAATASWWPWLVGMVVVYGLLVRLILLAWGTFQLRRALHRVDFNEPRHLEPWLRLDGRVIQTDEVVLEADEELKLAEPAVLSKAVAPGCLLIDRSMAAAREKIEAWVHQRLGWKLASVEVVEADYPSGNEEAFSRLKPVLKDAPRWLLVMPSPFTSFAAFAQFLEKMGALETEGMKVERGVLLAARNGDGNPAPPTEEWVRYWRDFLRADGRDVALIDWTAAT